MSMSFRAPVGTLKKGSFKVLEDNEEVALSNANQGRKQRLNSAPTFSKSAVMSNVRSSALSDSSNNPDRRPVLNKASVDDGFQFKIPKSCNNELKLEKSSSFANGTDACDQSVDPKRRSYSVPSESCHICPSGEDSDAQLIKSVEIDELEDNELYPELEIFREISSSDKATFSESPIRGTFEAEGLQDNVFPLMHNDVEQESEAGVDGSDIEDEDDDNLYPEIERLPIGYSTRILDDDDYYTVPLEWQRNWIDAPLKDETDVDFPEPPTFHFQLDNQFFSFGEPTLSPVTSEIDMLDFPMPPSDDEIESDAEESSFIR